MKLLRTILGIGEILAPLAWLEIGQVNRFPRAENLTCYAGVGPSVIANRGRMRHGGTCRNVNRCLNWDSSKPPPAPCGCGITAKDMSACSTIGSRPQRSWPSGGRPRQTSCRGQLVGCASGKLTRIRAPDPHFRARPDQVRPGSANVRHIWAAHRSRGECGSRSAQAHAGHHGEYMIHDETT